MRLLRFKSADLNFILPEGKLAGLRQRTLRLNTQLTLRPISQLTLRLNSYPQGLLSALLTSQLNLQISKLLLGVTCASLLGGIPAYAGGFNPANCTFDGKLLAGRVQYVDHFPDVKIQVVESFPDLKVKLVNNFPDECGKWKIVSSFPDIKVQVVNSFPDVKVKFVQSFPGVN